MAGEGSDLTIRNLHYESSVPHTTNLECVGTPSLPAKMTLLDAGITISGNTGSTVRDCALVLEQVRLTVNRWSFIVYEGGTLTSNRSWVRNEGTIAYPITVVAEARLIMTNSVFEKTRVQLGRTSTSRPPHLIGYSTFVDSPVELSGGGYSESQIRLENNIFYARSGAAISQCPDCSFLNNIAFPLVDPIPGVRVAQPAFVDEATSDYRLAAGSEAIDQARLGSPALDVSIDFDGRSRPAGAGKDLGAFEHDTGMQ